VPLLELLERRPLLDIDGSCPAVRGWSADRQLELARLEGTGGEGRAETAAGVPADVPVDDLVLGGAEALPADHVHDGGSGSTDGKVSEAVAPGTLGLQQVVDCERGTELGSGAISPV